MTGTPHVEFDDLTMVDDQLMAWQGRPFTGVAFETYADGRPRSEATYRDGVMNGPSRVWYPSGQLKEESLYWRGARHGITRLWNPQGDLWAERTYEFGILVADKAWDGGRLASDWSIDPDHNLYKSLELSRKRYGSSAPSVHDQRAGEPE